MEVTVSPGARELVQRRGGTVAVDLIASVGCGKRAEVATDTYLRGKDTRGYLQASDDGIEVLVSPSLARSATHLQLDTKGAWLLRRLAVRAAGLTETSNGCRT